MYTLQVAEQLQKKLIKLAKKNQQLKEMLDKKIREIQEEPHHYKPLRPPLQNKFRVHIGKSFVLVFDILENEKIVRLLDFDHHDNIYK